ncbi:MAG: DNA polymerase III subunit gamma/tau [Anaerovoracaceae bacterium]
MYRALYRAYRPEVFSEMLGQEHIVRILQSQLAQDAVSHAYLFCGTRGTGKTTTARLLAKGVNCLAEGERPCGECRNCKAIAEGSFMDLIEIDAASNNGVDNIRELRESVNYPPAVGRKKVYIIDEVHMLSSGAFNALLKTLEEPPEDVMFILCTTEPEKLPATVLSRCMRMDFRRVSERELQSAFAGICADRNVDMDEDALRLIVANADGSVRDGLTILDQCIAGRHGRISREDVLDSLGAVDEETYIRLTGCVAGHDVAGGLTLIAQLIENGKDARQILQGWMNHYRSLIMAKFLEQPQDILNMSLENVERVREQAREMDLEDINAAIIEIAQTIGTTKTSTQPRILLEVCFVKLASGPGASAAVPVRTVAEHKEPAAEVEKPAAGEPEEESGDVQEPAYAVSDDIQRVWEAVLEEGENTRPDFAMVRVGSVPVKMNDEEFVIQASGMAGRFIETNKEMVSGLIAKYSGGRRQVIVREDGAPGEEKKVDAEEIARKASEALGGIEIDIK